MNLEGSLDAFGLPDVFALLAMTGKSGGLRLRDATAAEPVEGVVWFHDGRITGASADRSRQALVRRLVGSGAVDDAALSAAVGRAATSPIGVARALLEAGAVEPELLREAAVDQVVDAVFDLSRWPNGDFGFDPGARNHDDVGVALDHSWLVTEAKARSVAWDEIRAVIPAADSVVTMPVVLAADPQLSRDEWALLSLVDGRRTLADLVELTGAGLFAVANVLIGLVRRGLLGVRDPQTPDHVEVVERRLTLLRPAEGMPVVEPLVVAAPAPEPTPEPVAAPSISGPEALTAARIAQGLSGSGSTLATPERAAAPGGARSSERPAARREVVPPRPEPFLPGRRPEHPDVAVTARESARASGSFTSSTPSPRSSGTTPNGTASAGPQSSYQQPTTGGARAYNATSGNTALAADPSEAPVHHPSPTPSSAPAAGTGEQGIIERDPAVNRSLLLRLIAGVRGL